MRFTTVVVPALVMMASSVAIAQIDTGSIVGTVSDGSGAVIPGASLTITNQATNVSVSVTSNNQGQYQVQALIPGLYTVVSKASGFASQQVKDIRIDVQSRVALNLKLQVGAENESITVSGEATVALDTQTADLGGVVNTKRINDLPLNGRNYSQLALLEAGVGKYYSGPNETDDRFSVNGNSELQNYFALDGVDNNSFSTNLQEGTVQSVTPPPDALEEFRIQTRTYSAEFGTSAGGVVNASIKSGTNQFHGNVWEYIRNEAFDANDWFSNFYGNKRQPFKQNQFGATIGGPIYRNRTFFFGDFQRTVLHQRSVQRSTVPTALMRSGDFSELPYALKAVVPSQSSCISQNHVALSCIDPVGQKLLQAYPLPNIASEVAKAGAPGSFGNTNYQYITGVPLEIWSADGKVDQTINDKNRVYGRYSFFQRDGVDPQWTADPVIGSSNFAADTQTHGMSAVASYIHTFSAATLNEFRVGANRIIARNNPAGGVKMGTSAAANYGLTGVPVTQYSYGLPPINIGGLQTIGGSTYRPQSQTAQVYQLIDDFTVLHGRHSMKFGYQYRRQTLNFLDLATPQGSISAGGIYTNNNGFGGADMLLGDMSNASFETIFVPHTFQPGHSFYAQDSWRATDKLVLNFGVRYELFAPFLERSNAVANFSPENGGQLVTPAKNAEGWYGRSLIHPDKNDFAPRVGVAYQISPNVVFRGGYGVFFQHSERYGSEAVMNLNYPYLAQSSLSEQQGSQTPVFYLKNGFPSDSLRTAAGIAPPLYSIQIRAQDPNQRTSYVSQGSFGVQVQMASKTTVAIDYTGNFARKMGRIFNDNQGLVTGFDTKGNPTVVFPYSNLNHGSQHSFVEYLRNDGNVNYNGLQAALKQSLTHGLQFGLAYTWSHSIADFNVPINGDYVGQNAKYNHKGERSDQTLDVRNRFVANATWNIPAGRGAQHLNSTPVLRDVLAGWQVNTIVTLQGGNPFTIFANDNSQTGPAHNGYANCDGNPFQGATTDHNRYTPNGGGYYINLSAYSTPTAGHFGSCHPYSVHGPGFKNTDLSVFRSFPIHESLRAEFRAEAFNVWNQTNFGAPYAYIGNPTSFGKIFNTVGNPRMMQFAMKIYY